MDDVFDQLSDANEHRDRATDLIDEATDDAEQNIRSVLVDSDTALFDISVSEEAGALTIQLDPEPLAAELESDVPDETDVAVVLSETATLTLAEDTFDGTDRDRIKNLKQLIGNIEDDHEKGAPITDVVQKAAGLGMAPNRTRHEIQKLKQQGELYEPSPDHLRTT